MAAATLDHSALNAQVVGCRRWTKVLSSIPDSVTCTCLPLYLLVPRARSPYSVSLFIVFRGGFASVRPHSRADHSLGQEPVYLYTHQQCALVNVRKVYEIYAGGHNLVNVWKMGNRRCPAARSRVIHCGPKAPQGAHPLIL